MQKVLTGQMKIEKNKLECLKYLAGTESRMRLIECLKDISSKLCKKGIDNLNTVVTRSP